MDDQTHLTPDPYALQGERYYVLWNPPEREELYSKRTPVGDTATAVAKRKKTIRRCPKEEAAIILAELVKQEMSTICFTKVRVLSVWCSVTAFGRSRIPTVIVDKHVTFLNSCCAVWMLQPLLFLSLF